ncbi:uncharacterized protein [Miscanthus floridulus]|uniref:uncharacterized protein n=1 Tax=Miscanthus floridulus TaxID=154761 RepID=UPI0034587B3B
MTLIPQHAPAQTEEDAPPRSAGDNTPLRSAGQVCPTPTNPAWVTPIPQQALAQSEEDTPPRSAGDDAPPRSEEQVHPAPTDPTEGSKRPIADVAELESSDQHPKHSQIMASRTGPSNLLALAPQKILSRRSIPQEPTGIVLGARHDGAEADMAPPEEAGEAEAPIVPEEALVESALVPINTPKVGQTRGGMVEASLANMATTRTLKPELPASSTIGGSAPEGAPMMEESLVMRSREKSLFLHREREVWGLATEVPRLQEEVASLQTKEREARQHANEADNKLKAMVTKAGEDATELERLCPTLDIARQESVDARRALENEQKLKEEAEGLAATLAGDVGVLQREKTVLEEQVKGEALVTFLLDVCSRFSDAL